MFFFCTSFEIIITIIVKTSVTLNNNVYTYNKLTKVNETYIDTNIYVFMIMLGNLYFNNKYVICIQNT